MDFRGLALLTPLFFELEIEKPLMVCNLKTCLNNLESVLTFHLSISAGIFGSTAVEPFPAFYHSFFHKSLLPIL